MLEAPGSAVMSSTFKKPHYAAEVEDFLQNRASGEEAARVQRYLQLIQAAAASTTAESSSSARGAPSTRKARPASTLGFQHQHQQLSQQQQQQLGAAAAAADTIGAPGRERGWLYTSTAAAGAAAAQQCTHAAAAQHNLRPHSAAAAASSAAPPAAPAACKEGSAGPAGATPAQAVHVGGTAPAQAVRAAGHTAGAPAHDAGSVYITNNQAVHGLKDLYPNLWNRTIPICRPDPAPNKNFISEWGESLRQGSGEAWRPYLATTNQLTNAQVVKPMDDFAVRADEALIGWVAKQQMHFAELLSPKAAAAVTALLEGRAPAAAGSSGGSSGGGSGSSGTGSSGVLSLCERKELVAVLRQLAAVVQPDRAQSTSHMLHCKQTSVEQPSTTALLKEQTRIRTMGFPRKVVVKGFRPLSSAAKAVGPTAAANAISSNSSGGIGSGASAATGMAGGADAVHGMRCDGGRLLPPGGSKGSSGSNDSSGGCGSSGSSSRRPAVRASEMIDTQKSKVPLKWAASSLVPPCSTYTSAHGTQPGGSPQMFVTKFREVNVGMGHVDQHMYPPGSTVYPVEALYLELPAKAQPQAPDVKTTYRASYPANCNLPSKTS